VRKITVMIHGMKWIESSYFMGKIKVLKGSSRPRMIQDSPSNDLINISFNSSLSGNLGLAGVH